MPTRLTLEDLASVIRLCDAIEIDECTPPYFQDFLATRLAPSAPELSARVGQLDSDQMGKLCEAIRAVQAVLRW